MRRSSVLLIAVLLGLTGCSSGSSGGGQSKAAPNPSSGTGSAPGALPGGTSGKDVIKAHHLLDDKGRVAPGPTAPKGKTVNAAICDYVFGSTGDVAKVADLAGDVTLGDQSGYLYSGGSGEGVQCIYRAAGKEAFVLAVWSKATTDTDETTHFVQVALSDGFNGVSAYAPKYKGGTMGASTAKRWLKQAGTHVAHGSV